MRYNKVTIYHAIYIKVFFYVNVSYLIVSTDYVINTTNNDTKFPELRIFFEEAFYIKVQEVCFLKYLTFSICQYPIGFIVYQTYHIMELVNEFFQLENLEILIHILGQTPYMKKISWLKFH